MPELSSKRFALLSSYEDLTRRERLAINEGDLENLRATQEKKGKVLAALQEEPRDGLSDGEVEEFNRRLATLREQEASNTKLLAEKMAENRGEYRMLSQNAASATKLKRVYAKPASVDKARGNLKGRA